MDSQPSDASDNSSSHVTLHQTNLNILDPSLLNHKVLTQIDACCFVIRLSVTDAQYWNTISNIIEQVSLHDIFIIHIFRVRNKMI